VLASGQDAILEKIKLCRAAMSLKNWLDRDVDAPQRRVSTVRDQFPAVREATSNSGIQTSLFESRERRL